MAVVDFRELDQAPITRNFQPPKRASDLKYWWKAAKKAIPAIPDWQERFRQDADVDLDTIIVEGHQRAWVVSIARKKYLKG